MSYNLKYYEQFITGSVKDCSDTDKRWLANRMAKIYRKGHECRDNFRLCRADARWEQSKRYQAIKAGGCCGSFDVELTNPQTGSVFWYGFNYGH